MLACTDKSVEACGMLLAQTANYSTEDVIMLHTFQETKLPQSQNGSEL